LPHSKFAVDQVPLCGAVRIFIWGRAIVNWDKLLIREIRTAGGTLRTELNTLGAALDMIDEELSEEVRQRPHWVKARNHLITAAQTGSPSDINAATSQLVIALSIDGMLEVQIAPRAD
jgi:hypothetical protein